MLLLDTSIIIDHLRRTDTSHLLTFVEKHPEETIGISILTIQELFEGKSTENPTKLQTLISTIAPLHIFPYTYNVAQIAGEIARDLKEPIEFVDAGIAATAILNEIPLLTLNKKHFTHIPQIQLI